MEITLAHTGYGIIYAVDQQSRDEIEKWPLNATMTCVVKRQNNLKFHRKLFALFNFAFEHWEPKEVSYKGNIIAKNFDQFRKDLTILAGYGEPIFTLRGEIRYVAKSLSFSSMPQDDREKLYSAVVHVVLQKVLINYSKDQLDHIIDELLHFT